MSKEEVSVNVMVFRQVDYKENDVIINALGEDGTPYAFYARGIRKNTSKNAYAVQPFMFSNMTYFKSDTGMHLLKSAKSMKNYYSLYTDYDKVITAYILLDIVSDISSLNVDSSPLLFQLLVNALDLVNHVNDHLLLSVFIVKVMQLNGIVLICDHCALCQSETINYISTEDGGFICHDCLVDNNRVVYDEEILKLFRIVNKVNLEDLDKLEFSDNQYKTILEIIYEFYTSFSGFRIKNISELI